MRLVATAEFTLEPQRKHASFNEINGLYADASFTPGGFKGIRVISDRSGKTKREELVRIRLAYCTLAYCTASILP